MNLVLKDALSADVTFQPKAVLSNGMLYERKADHLIGRSQVSVIVTENGKTNRIKGKLTVPAILDCSTITCGTVPEVQYTEIGSFDFSVYRAGTEKGRQDLAAMFASLVANAIITGAVVDGDKPNA